MRSRLLHDEPWTLGAASGVGAKTAGLAPGDPRTGSPDASLIDAAAMPPPPPPPMGGPDAGQMPPPPPPMGGPDAGPMPPPPMGAPDASMMPPPPPPMGGPDAGAMPPPCMTSTTGRPIPCGGPDGGIGMPPPPFSPPPLGQWSFDDCNPFRTNLADSSPNFNTAFRAVSVACVSGISGQAVSLAAKNEDIVYVPDQPSFTFGQGLTIAGWFNPNTVSETRTLARKRDDGTSSAFALVLHDGKYGIAINLGKGRGAMAVGRDPAVAGVWTHVAATYDGATLRLYVNGIESGSTYARGAIATAGGPLLIGNDGSRRIFDGAIDNAYLDTRALSAAEVLALTCVRRDPTTQATPPINAPALPGTSVAYDIAITNNDTSACAPNDYFFNAGPMMVGGIDVQPAFQIVPQVPPGTSGHVALTVTGSDDPDPGTYIIPYSFFTPSSSPFMMGNFVSGSVQFVLAASPCRVSSTRELMITNVSVVDDPVRTTAMGPPGDPRAAVWTFKHLVESMAPTPDDAPAMVEDMLLSFTSSESINGFEIDARPGMQAQVLSAWPRIGGKLDLARAPVRLQAIVNRLDLRNLSGGDAGEGRFVFSFTTPDGFFPLQATIIFEYKLPATSPAAVNGWASAWHALGALPFPSEDYNAALQAITERFAGAGVRPGHPNGSAINAVRTNEIAFGDNGLWQLREFALSPVTGRLVPATIKLTPDAGFNNTPLLASFINANEPSILAETHTVPDQLDGSPFLAGAVFNNGGTWFAPGINNNEARHHFAINTCNGCHSLQETGTGFTHISPRFPGGEAGLSGFLTGTTVFDPVTGQPRTFSELRRRAADVRTLICP